MLPLLALASALAAPPGPLPAAPAPIVQDLPSEVILGQSQSLVLAAAAGACQWTLQRLAPVSGARQPLGVGPAGAPLVPGATAADRLELRGIAPGTVELRLLRRCQSAEGRVRSARQTAQVTVLSPDALAARGPARLTVRLALDSAAPLPRSVPLRVAVLAAGQPLPAALGPDTPGLVALDRVGATGTVSWDLPPGAYAVVAEVDGRVLWEGALRRPRAPAPGPPLPGALLGAGQATTQTLTVPAAVLFGPRP